MIAWHDAGVRGVKTRTLGADWSTMYGQPIDPYLLWADLSGFRSIAREGAPGGDVASPDEELRIAAELAPGGALPDADKISWNEVLRTSEAVFATAFVRAGDLAALLVHPSVRRVELGFRAPAGKPRGKAVAPPKDEPREPTQRRTLAVIDFGCAFAHERFRRMDENGEWKSRIAWLWDQGRTPVDPGGAPWRAVPGPDYGRELSAADIDGLLAAHRTAQGVDEDAVYRSARYDSVQPVLMHGTHVLDLAAGESPFAVDATAEIIFVQLPDFAIEDTSGGSMVTHVLDALAYIRARTGEGVPLVVNLSYGAMAGPHDGSTLVESAMDALIEDSMPLPSPDDTASTMRPKRYLSIVLPAGNSFDSNGHAEAALTPVAPSRTLHWQVLADNPTDAFLEIWYPRSCAEQVEVSVTPPGGRPCTARIDRIATLQPDVGTEPVAAIVHRRMASAGQADAIAFVAIAPTRTRDGARPAAPAGVWTIEVRLVGKSEPKEPVLIHAWIERDDPPIGSGAPPRQSFLLTGDLPLGDNADSPANATVQRRATCNSIANGTRTVIVGACVAKDGEFRDMAAYSSAGPTRNSARKSLDGKSATNWPDLVAPAEESSALAGVLAAGTRSGIKVRMNGTSVAAPQVARAILDTCREGGAVAPSHSTSIYTQAPQPPQPPSRLQITPVGAPRAGRGLLVAPSRGD